ncbi:MAG: NAD+ synthase [Leptolyngbyaceae cyanobacterium MO_188.B28]|nr:NAD+ synthase [Leptolyngbyaceae cyanobacterium MO_188.B28]
MKIGIAQLNPTIGDLTGNAQQILEAANQAANQGVRLLLTPELSLCGYPPRDLLMRPSFTEAMALTLAQLAQDLPSQLAALVGMTEPNQRSPQKGGKPLFNSMALLEGGQVRRIFHKRLLPTYDVFDDDRYFEPGNQINHFELEGIRIGVTICEDLWNDEEFWRGKRIYDDDPTADLVRQGVDLVVNLSGSPYTLGKQRFREDLLHHSAARHQRPIIYANQVGANDDLIFDGASVAFNRRGELVSRALAFQSDLTIVDFDPTQRDLLPSHITPLTDSEDEEIWSALVMGVRDYARKCGFSKAVIGLSGGVDSALVAAIAARALGPNNVLGVLMPSPFSSDHSVKDALALAQNLGIRTETLPIGALMKGYDQTFETLFAGTDFGVAEENIQSRIRGNLLMAISNKFGCLLLSTGNKSEMAVGYCTLYGDMNGGLAVIADVPKTRVYSICRWLNHSHPPIHPSTHPPILHPSTPKEIIPASILTKPPSAELKPDQVDQDSLPPYEILDDILFRLIQRHESAAQIVAAGHDPQVVDKVIRLVTRAEFKRRQAPPVLKITDRAFGTGWRMPIASRWSLNLPISQTATT